jgi:prophage regulatory protein
MGKSRSPEIVPFDDLPDTALLRLQHILAPTGPVPTSKSNWWQGIKDGRFPRPSYVLGPKSPTWSVGAIRKLLVGEE